MAKREVAVKDCDRCGGRKKPATQTRRWSVDKDQLEIDLCDEHGAAFDRDTGMWARLSRDITPEVYKHQYDMTRERGIDRAVGGPRFRPVPPEDPRVVVVQKLPAKFHVWRLTDHAKERCAERGISEHDALLAASDPGLARTDPNTGYWIHTRGDVHCIVNRNTNHVITAITSEQLQASSLEKEVARASN